MSLPDMPAPANLVDMLRQRAARQGEAIACRYLGDGEEIKAELSFAALDRDARALAARLQGLNAGGTCALLLYPPGLEFLVAFFGCLYAGVIAVPLPVPRVHGSMRQFLGIVGDLDARLVLTTATTRSKLERLDAPWGEDVICLETEQTAVALAAAWQAVAPAADDIAYLQYTSGSTSARKGVMISHANVIANLRGIAERFAHHDASVSVNWLPHFHDLGLVSGILQPLYHGHLNVMMSPTAFVQQPLRWLQAISRYRGTYSNSPNYGYDLCVRRCSEAARATLDLSSWEVALNGAEPVREATLAEFAACFASCGLRPGTLYPAYGLAEATLVVSGGRRGAAPVVLAADAVALEQGRVTVATGTATRELVGCGRALEDTQIRIVDPESLRVCTDGEVGEIWVAGPGVAAGYWQRAEDTVETFHATPVAGDGRHYLRTGDLGTLVDGELLVTGRIKDLIIVRGSNHYPQDIEWTIERCHAAFRPGCGAAFAIDSDSGEQLVVAYEIEREHLRQLPVDELAAIARRAVAEAHELTLHTLVLLKTGTIPRTSSGKIQRRQCRREHLDGTLAVVGTAQLGGGASAPAAAPPTDADVAPQTPAEAAAHPTAATLCAWLREYAETRIHSRLMDERRALAPHLLLDFGNQGLLGLQTPTLLGGLGLDQRDYLRVLAQLGAIDLTLAMMTIVHNTLGIGPILRHAAAPLRDVLVPRLASGRELAAFAMTEPGAGSNPQAIASRAQADGAGWRLYGEKSWSGSAAWASVINVFTQTVDAEGRAHGISGFVVPRTAPGLRMGGEALTMGMRAMVQNTVYLDGVLVTNERLLGHAGVGMTVAQEAMMAGRLAIAGACLGGMKRCLQVLLRYASRRQVAGGRLLDNPLLLERIGSLSAATSTIEALTQQVATALDRGAAMPLDAVVVLKTAAPEWLWQTADTLLQFLGGRGYVETNMAAQMLRDARVARILEGPTEALLMFLGSRVINEGESLRHYLGETLGQPAVATRLDACAAEVLARCLAGTARFGGDVEARRWACALVGQVATAATLLAAALGDAAVAAPAHCRSWAEQQFESAIATALMQADGRQFSFDAARAAAVIEAYAEDIGDVEQQLEGEEQMPDPLLRRAPATPARPTAAPAASPAPAPAPRASADALATATAMSTTTTSDSVVTRAPRDADLVAFIVAWVERELKLAAGTLDAGSSLLDYGVDSVTAVLLCVAIEERLEIEFPPDLVYQHPRVADLAAVALAQMR